MNSLLRLLSGYLGLGSALVLALALSAPAAHAGPIAFDTWGEFGFSDVDVAATGCDPADPSGSFCTSSSGTPTVPLDAPAWTFTSVASASLTVTDAFVSGDQFEVFDFGVSLGLTSPPAAATVVDCGDDPVVCLGTAGISRAVFLLGAGGHSITLVPRQSQGGGSGYLLVSGAAVPEPGPIALFAAGLLALALARRRPFRG